jgi:hypothetical protein
VPAAWWQLCDAVAASQLLGLQAHLAPGSCSLPDIQNSTGDSTASIVSCSFLSTRLASCCKACAEHGSYTLLMQSAQPAHAIYQAHGFAHTCSSKLAVGLCLPLDHVRCCAAATCAVLSDVSAGARCQLGRQPWVYSFADVRLSAFAAALFASIGQGWAGAAKQLGAPPPQLNR